MKALAIKLLRVNPNFYAFLGGVFLSMSINLYSNIAAQTMLPSRWRVLIASAGCMFVSALSWSAIAWQLDGVQKLIVLDSPTWVDPDELFLRVSATKKLRLLSFYLVALATALVGLGILLVGIRFNSASGLTPPLPTISATPSQ